MSRIVLELTNRCNLRCRHCVYRRHGGHDDFPLDLLDSLLAQAKSQGFDELAFTGGEPTLHPQFFEILDRTVAAGYRWGMVSNGWTFPKRYRQLLPFRDALTGLTFSLDGARRSTHDGLRGPGSYRRLLQAMSVCMAVDLPFTLNMVITRYNQTEVEALVELAARLGAGGLRFGPLMPGGDPDLELTLQERRAVEQRILALQRTAPLPVALAPGYYTTELFPCAPLNGDECNIDWQGNVSFCCHLSGYGRGRDGVGRLATLSFAEALSRLRRLRERLRLEKATRSAGGDFRDEDYFPCLYCYRHFGKTTPTTSTVPLEFPEKKSHARSL